MSKDIHLIIKGKVNIMNKECAYDYGALEDGSYFGDISILLNEPNNFSYTFNNLSGTPLQLLSISADKFMNICDKFPISKDILTKQAIERKKIFLNYKTIKILSFMKTITRNQRIINTLGK